MNICSGLQAIQHNRCNGCGQNFTHRQLTLLGIASDGRQLTVCHSCRGKLRKILGAGVFFADPVAAAADIARRAGMPDGTPTRVSPPSPWNADDAAWFRRHPNRSHRLRRPIGKELDQLAPEGVAGEGGKILVVVRQVAPGQRMRAAVRMPEPMPNLEAVAAACFEAIVIAEQRDTDLVSIQDVLARVQPWIGRGRA